MKFYQTLYTIGKLTLNQLKENQVIQFMLYSEYQGRTHTQSKQGKGAATRHLYARNAGDTARGKKRA